MSSTSSRGLSEPLAAYSAICPGPGSPARSGSTPEATPVVRTVLMSRVPVYFTLAPVCCSHGATICRKAFCSSPPHVPMTLTVLPWRSLLLDDDPPPLEQAVAASVTTASGTSPRIHFFIDTSLLD